MKRLVLPQNSLAFGELSPNSRARDDIAAYGAGAKSLLNYNLLLEGGVERRWGSERIATLQGQPRLIPFEFNEDQQYIFVLTNLRLDVWSIDDSDPDVLPVVTFVETVTSNADWTTALLPTLHWVHSGDTMFITDGTGAQIAKMVKRVSATSFTITDFAFEQNTTGAPLYQPYHRFAASTITLQPGATTGTGVSLAASANVFVAGHVGVIFRLTDVPADDSPKEVVIASVTNGTTATCDVRETLDGTLATTIWDEAVFSPVRGYQLAMQLAEQRLMIAGSRDFPNNSWLSNTSAFFKFEEGDGDDDQMIDRAIDSGVIETIRAVVAADNIEIFTDQGEHYMPLSETKFITPSTAALRNQTTFGINPKVPPLQYDGATIFLQSPGVMLREYLFNDTANKYESLPISLLATHLFQNKLGTVERPVDMQYAAVINSTERRPESYYFTVNNGNGEIVQFHSIRSEKVAGFSRWNTDGRFVDVAVVGHQMFVATLREVGGDVYDAAFSDDFGRDDEIYSLERMEPSFTLDFAAQALEPIPVKKFSGFDHLAGRTVKVVSRNAIYHGEFTVASDGTITIDEDDVEIVAGLDYTTRIRTLRPRFTSQGYTIMGQIKRLINIVIELNDVFSLKANGNVLLIRKVTDDLELDPNAVTGQREFMLRGYGRTAEVEILQDAPLPLRILGYQLTIGV